MNALEAILSRGAPVLVAIAAAAGLVFLWQSGGSGAEVLIRVPVTAPGGSGADSGVSALEERTLTEGSGKASALPGAWPCFRGAQRDGIARDETPLAGEWTGTPRELWQIEVGEGYAGAAVLGGKVYLMDYDREGKADALRCLSLADGAEIWRFSYPLSVKRNHGMSRTVPAVTEKLVVALGPKCHVSCLDAETGEFKWGIDLVREYGTTVPPWYAGQCPLIDDGKVILAPAGSSLLIAVDGETGEVVWKTPNPRSWKMTHVSVVPMEIAGQRQYVYCGHRGVAGVSADDGSLLWDTSDWKISIATVASPVPLPDDRLFLSGGYKAGSLMVKVSEAGGTWLAEPLFRLPPEEFGATQQTPIFHDGHLYGVRPNGELVCLGLDGKVLWASGSGTKFGLGPFLVADGKIYVMDDHGTLTMAVATPEAFRPLGSAQVLDGHDSWGPMALAGGRLLVRDLTRMVCLEVGKK